MNEVSSQKIEIKMMLPFLVWTLLLWWDAGRFFAAAVATASSVTNNNANNWTESRTSQVFLQLPVELYNASGVPHVRAEFGGTSSGRSITTPQSLSAHVYYVEKTLCSPLTNWTEGFPTTTAAAANNREPPYLLLVDGGGCTAVTKARHAQQAGAAAVLIGERHCACWDHSCQTALFPNDTYCSDYQMVDDGSGGDVSIPAVLLFRPTYETMKERLQDQNQPIVLELQWNLEPILDNDENAGSSLNNKYKPIVHFWTTPYDPYVPYDTYRQVARTVQALADYIRFEPRYRIWNGTTIGCRNSNNGTTTTSPDQACPGELCTNGNRYCALHQEQQNTGNKNNINKTVPPFHIVEETVRRWCIFQTFPLKGGGGAAGGDHATYWQYVLFHKQNCHQDDTFADPHCRADALQHAGLSGHHETSALQQCLDQAGPTNEDVPNTILDDVLDHVDRAGLIPLPTLSIQHRPVLNVHARDILEAICDAYWYSQSPTIPPVCETCGGCPNTLGCLEHPNQVCVQFNNRQRQPDNDEAVPSTNKKSSHHHRGGFWTATFWWLSILSILAVVGYYGYDKYGRHFILAQRQRQSNQLLQLNDYLQLQSDE
jgi:hypothetical protein